MRHVLLALVILPACSGAPGSRGQAMVTWRALDSVNAELPPGIRVYSGENSTYPLRAWYVAIDARHASFGTRVLVSDDTTDGRELVSSFAEEPNTCVAVNGGYFSMDRSPAVHGGLLVHEGRVVAPATASVTRDSITYPTARAALGWRAAGVVELRWVATRGDTVFAWDAPPANRPGTPASLAWDEARTWPVVQAIGAGPALLWDGEIKVTTDEEVFFGSSIPAVHPRTAAGRTADGYLILMVVDGRQPASRGVDLEELAQLMRSAGAVDALNLDGGGSSALVVRGVLLNRPAGAIEREVMSALAIRCSL